jgi:hypothetical protein
VFWNTAHFFSEGEFFKGLFVGCAPAAGGRTCRYSANRAWGKGGFASALVAGVRVVPNKGYFQPSPQGSYIYGDVLARYGGASPSGHTSDATGGQWFYTKHRYVGLQFLIEGRKHYGWARVAVSLVNGAIEAVLTGYAYETVPNTPIVAGKTTGPDVVTLAPDVRANETNTSDAAIAPFAPSLGRLAQGASGIPSWRSVPPRAPAPH